MNTCGTSLVEYFQQLSAAGEQRAAVDVLRDVASLFSATELGLASLNGAGSELIFSATPNPNSLSWRTDAALMERIRSCWTAQMHTDAAGEWLICLAAEPGGDARLSWLRRPGAGGWTESDRVLWMFAAQALVRWLHHGGANAAALQGRLEQAAVITSRLSHDFGNYLTGIMGFTELSLSQAALDSTLHRYLQEVLASASQGADWIRRLHGFCRRSTTPAWPTQLASVLAQEESRLRAAGQPGMHWNVRLAENLPLLAIDGAALQTAIAEITANSRDATKNRGTITVTARAVELTAEACTPLLGPVSPGPCVELSISDEGPGIAADDRAKLFSEIFFSTKTRHRGLGLLVVYGILQRCRGGLRIEPGPEGRGTCVRLYVPSAVVVGAALAGNAEPPHVLLVHADPLLTGSMAHIIETHGCRVSVASNPQAALTACRAKGASISLVVSDVMSPHLAGLDLARRILEHDPKTNFIFLLAQSSFHGSREEDLFKRFDVVRWPMEPGAFLALIQAALKPDKTASESGKNT